MIEPEIAFADLDDLADLAEDFLKCVSREVLDACADDVRFFEQRIDQYTIARLKQVTDKEFVRMDYSDAIKALEGSGRRFEFPVEWGLDLQTDHERWLTEEYARGPVIVMNYPKSIKAFYMRLNDDGKPLPPWMCWCPASARSSAAASGRNAWRCLMRAWRNTAGRGTLVVPRPAPVRHRAPRRVRSGARAARSLHDRHGQHPRCDSLSPHPRERGL